MEDGKENADHRRYDLEEEGDTGAADLVEVSEETHGFLTATCMQSVPNETRSRVRSRFPLHRVAAIKSPNIDAFMRTEISSGARSSDKELAKIRIFVLDSLAPLTALLEKGDPWNPLKCGTLHQQLWS